MMVPSSASEREVRTSPEGRVPHQRSSIPNENLDALEILLAEFSELEHGPERDRLRDRLVTGYLPVARRLAGRYRDRGVPIDDLAQVASIGLIKAIDRYEPGYDNGFLSYAIPTIQGELRRYFRDLTWSMRVPRALKERHLQITAATSELSARLNRAPRPSELAAHLNMPLDEVIEGLQVSESYNSTSLDQRLVSSQSGGTLADVLGEADRRLELVEYRHAIRPLLAALPDRERSIIMMRFFAEMTQSQIAERIGVSQMHISRLISHTLARVRDQLEQADREALTEPPRGV